MMPEGYFSSNRPLLTVMIQAKTKEDAITTIKKSIIAGAEAFGIQVCKLNNDNHNIRAYNEIFDATGGRPLYVTNYRAYTNEGKSDDELADEMLEMANNRPLLCDVMGDMFDKTFDELSMNSEAVKKQMDYIARIHSLGSKVLMSSHLQKFTSAERVLNIALEPQHRGADVSKIVTSAENENEEIENLRITYLLKEKLDISFLFLSGGTCKIHRRIGPMLGSFTYLCAYEYDEMATTIQPLLTKVKMIRDNFDFF